MITLAEIIQIRKALNYNHIKAFYLEEKNRANKILDYLENKINKLENKDFYEDCKDMLHVNYTLKNKKMESRIIMLPTNYKSTISINTESGKLVHASNYHLDYFYNQGNHNPQHLYFTINEEIKPGEWYIMEYDNHLEVVQNTSNKKFGGKPKIIVTTDKSLTFDKQKTTHVVTDHPLPYPSEEIIKEYCDSGGNLDTVEIEYITTGKIIKQSFPKSVRNRLEIKTNTNNQAFISFVKKYFTKEEVLDLCEDYHDMLISNYDQTQCPIKNEKSIINNWKKENL